jgi:hypothetical protein
MTRIDSKVTTLPPLSPAATADPIPFIVSANLERRNLTKGQRAMAMAMIYPEPEKGGRGKKRKPPVSGGFSRELPPLSPAATAAMLQHLIREVDLDEAVHAALVQIEASFSRNVLAR